MSKSVSFFVSSSLLPSAYRASSMENFALFLKILIQTESKIWFYLAH